MLQTDGRGRNKNFLATDANYQFVRQMHQKNLIIPIVGDFAGPKAMRAVAGYIRDRGAEVKGLLRLQRRGIHLLTSFRLGRVLPESCDASDQSCWHIHSLRARRSRIVAGPHAIFYQELLARMTANSILDRVTDRRLLDLRLCDLPLKIEGTPLQLRIEKLYRELTSRGLTFRPHVWLGEEWFTPDGVGGFGIPFYLAHPRLMKLERSQMLEVEGASEAECMRILRHEAGHALDNAYRLHTRRSWADMFGSYRVPYPEWYQPQPGSRDYVLNLDAWYAQAHPAEDFAETFAVWLKPGTAWRREYENWGSLRKLEYVDQLMKQLAFKPPKNTSKRHVDSLRSLKTTLARALPEKTRVLHDSLACAFRAQPL
jgi:hypothetical protein